MPHAKPFLADEAAALSERELVQGARIGDSTAFRVIIQRNNRRLFRIARSILKNDGEAEDVVQEVYVRAFEHLSEFRGESALSTWLARIAINEAQGRLRRQRPSVDLAVLDSGGNGVSEVIPFPLNPNSDPERAAAQRQVRLLMEQTSS